MCVRMSNHVCGIHCHVHASCTSGCGFVYFTVQYCIEYSSTISLFQAISARGWLHWTPCCATQGAYQWRRDRIERPEKRQREIRGRRSNWRTEKIHDAGNGKGIFFIWGGTVIFWGTGPERRMVHEDCNNRSEYDPVLPCHLLWEKKSYSDITGSFFQEGR